MKLNKFNNKKSQKKKKPKKNKKKKKCYITIYKYKDELLHMIDNNDITLIIGETGMVKVHKYHNIYHYLLNDNSNHNNFEIYITHTSY